MAVDCLRPAGNHLVLETHSTTASAVCPLCDQPSTRRHSSYRCRLADLPWQGRTVELHLRVGRFRCTTVSCPRRIFAERLPAAAPSGQRDPAASRRRPGPPGPCDDVTLLDHLRALIETSRFHGEGHRKLWARLRFAGIRTSMRRVRRLMRENQLLAPHRVGRPKTKAHEGTMTTPAVDQMWGTDMTQTVT